MLCPICKEEKKKSWMRGTAKGNWKCPLCGRVWDKNARKVLYCPTITEQAKKRGDF